MDDKEDRRIGNTLCGAKNRDGSSCRGIAMQNGRCRMHGGSTPHGIESVHFKTGRYSRYIPGRLMDKYEEAEGDPELLNMRGEIALIDARISELLTRVDSGQTASSVDRMRSLWAELLTHRASGDTEAFGKTLSALGRTIQVATEDYEAWSEIMSMLESRRKIVESERKRLVDMEQMLTVEQGLAMVTLLASSVRKYVSDPIVLAQIQEDFDRVIGGGSRANINAEF